MKSLKVPFLATAAALLMSTPAWATTITLTTLPGASNGTGNPVDASATFTTSLNTVTVVVQNLLTNAQVKDVAQNVSGIFFTLSTGQTAGSFTSMSGASENISGKTGTAAGTVTSGWHLNTGVGADNTAFELCVLACSGAGPSETIIGGSPGSYPNVNGSINGNGAHNPFLDGPVTFTLSIPGVTAASTISGITFQFGTTEGEGHFGGQCTDCTSPLPPADAPEPGSLLLLGTGLVIGAALLRRRFAL